MSNMMKASKRVGAIILLGCLGMATTGISARGMEFPLLQQVAELLRQNTPDMDPDALDHAAVEGIVESFGGRVTLLNPRETSAPELKMRLFEDAYFYLRPQIVSPGLAREIELAVKSAYLTNRLQGLVLDLRFTGGQSHEEAVAVVGLFQKKGFPILELNQEMLATKRENPPFDIPVAVLVNGKTRRAAELLAAALRLTRHGLLIGQTTAGQVYTYKNFELANGEVLQIANGELRLSDGTLLSNQGVPPDISVSVEENRQRLWIDDPYKQFAATDEEEESRLNEAELVRRHNQLNGTSTEAEPPPRATPSAPTEHVVNDPMLARGLDLLKGLVLVRHLRQP